MEPHTSLPLLPSGTVLHGVTWDGTQWRWGGICVADPRISQELPLAPNASVTPAT